VQDREPTSHHWLSSITKKGEIKSASRPSSGVWMSDDKQLEVYSFTEFYREFSLVKFSTFNQKGKRKGKGSKAQRSKILYFI
jgi:hypothetical protein